MSAVRHIRLDISYQGTRYCGWQFQPDQPTVQAVLEKAYFDMTGLAVRVKAASRTDSGVHAAHQVVCLPNASRHGPQALLKGLNALLPDDVVVREASWAPAGFDPRRAAVGKHYRYVIHVGNVPPLFDRDLRWYVRARLDLDTMNRAVTGLLGEHDFSAFRAADCEAASAVRTLDRIGWQSWDSPDGPALVFDIWGRGFLKQMVRNVVGTSVEIGRGRMNVDDMSRILHSRDRLQAGPTAPACGLCLMRVIFQRETHGEPIV